jgi:chemotaxis protein CheC
MEDINLTERYLKKIQSLVTSGFENAARGLSGMIGMGLKVTDPTVKLVHLNDVPMTLGGPENDAVGIYLRVEGELSGQIMLVMPYEKSLEIVDMVSDLPFGTTQKLGRMERSALAEVGNMTGTFFINALADATGFSSRPTPPAVMVDMVGAILDVIVATIGEVGDQVFMFQATFSCGDRETKTDFWVIPDPVTLEKLTQ